MDFENSFATTGSNIETVKALHQTVVALRIALEESKKQISELKSKACPLDLVKEAIRSISAENCHLEKKNVTPKITIDHVNNDHKAANEIKPSSEGYEEISPRPKKSHHHLVGSISIKNTKVKEKRKSVSLESLAKFRTPYAKEISVAKSVSFVNVNSTVTCEVVVKKNNKMCDSKNKSDEDDLGVGSPEETGVNRDNDVDQDQEVDDIELIFTTDDTKESDFKEELVSIETSEASNLLCATFDLDQNLDVSDRELDDDVFNDGTEIDKECNIKRDNSQMLNSKSDNSINNEERSLKSYYSYQDSSFENKSLEKDESFDRFEEKIRILETDISKCGIQDVEYTSIRRNTCPNPLQYRPLIHREALGKGLNSKKLRPILAQSSASRRESGAQTEISALPKAFWRSESNLVNKAKGGERFTTLPSKFPMPGSSLRLSEKTVEARRVLLSDIGFTSMVPELSRSADHLFPAVLKPPVPISYGQYLQTPDLYSPAYTSQKFTWTTTTATPSEGSHSHSRYSSMYPLSPPAASRRCSAPVSPSRRISMKTTPSRVHFANGSLPELRGDWTLTADSGDSTDSLVEEAENYLRRSIDCIVSERNFSTSHREHKKGVPRRASAPEPDRDNVPPQGWQPFLPRTPRDLKPDHWVKVITPEGRVRGGRVRYVGVVMSQSEPFVGVQLGTPDGISDGTYNTRRYFQCEPYHGIFVPFKKVIMGWRP